MFLLTHSYIVIFIPQSLTKHRGGGGRVAQLVIVQQERERGRGEREREISVKKRGGESVINTSSGQGRIKRGGRRGGGEIRAKSTPLTVKTSFFSPFLTLHVTSKL